MSEEMLSGTAQRIAAARERAGISHADMADHLGLTLPSYHDLEAYDDEAFDCISLEQFLKLARVLRVSPRSLISGQGDAAVTVAVSAEDVAHALRRRVDRDADGGKALGDDVGWEIHAALVDPTAIWSDWCLAQLRDVCGAIGLSWKAVLPDSPHEVAV
jgi:hypothetical protein